MLVVGGAAAGLIAEADTGWKRDPYPEETSFVAPRATKEISKTPRTLTSNIRDEKKLKTGLVSPRILLDNPYMDPADPFFNIPRSMACTPDGGLVVASTAKLATGGRFQGTPYASGFWKIAPDGAITALAAKHIVVESAQYPICDAPFEKSRIRAEIKPMTRTKDGGFLFASEDVILKLTAAGRVELVPPSAPACAPPGLSKEAIARFKSAGAAVEDPRGAIWASDPAGCALLRIDPDGTTHTVLDKATVCPTDDPANYVLMNYLAWDNVKDELVTSGAMFWGGPKTNVYSSIWRVSPSGKARRAYLALKVGKDPLAKRVDGISGLAIDSKGRIHFGAGIAEGSGGQIRRLDEKTGASVVVTGSSRPTDVSYADGPVKQAYFGTVRDLCFAPNDTLFVNDASLVIRKLTTSGQVTTWAF